MNIDKILIEDEELVEELVEELKEELWDADPNCDHEIVDNFWHGGGIKCTKCGGWCCY